MNKEIRDIQFRFMVDDTRGLPKLQYRIAVEHLGSMVWLEWETVQYILANDRPCQKCQS